MKRFKNILAAMLALCCTAAVAACDDEAPVSGGSSAASTAAPTTTASTSTATMNEQDANKVAEIEIDAKPLANGTVKFLSSWDLNPAEGQPISVALEMFQTKFGGKIELVNTTWDGRFDKLGTLVASDDSPDMFSAADMDVFPKGALKGMFSPLDEYIDFSSELWAPMASVNEQFAYKGKHYVGAIDTDSQCMMFYNAKTIEDNSLDDPMELAKAGNWTWDTFWEMMTKFCDRDDGKWATDGWWFEGGFSLTCGLPYIGMQDGKIVHNFDTAEIDKVQEFMLNMKNNDLPLPKSEFEWQVQPKRIAEGKTLFYPVGAYALYPYNGYIQDFGDMADVRIAPMPKCPYTDDYYLPAIVSGFSLCKGAKNPEGVAAYLTCAMASRDSAAAKEIGKRQALEDYGWTEQLWNDYQYILELTNEHPVIEMYNAVTDKVADLINNPMKEGYNSGASWTQTREGIRAAVQNELDKANEELSAG